MDRRKFICAVAQGLLAMPFAASAQRSGKSYRIGVLGAGTAAEHSSRMEVFRQALRDLGWVNEHAIVFDERWADLRYERLPQLAEELVALKVDLIFADGGTPAVEAALKATRVIPIVFPTIGDPVAQKLIQSMAHPGGNATGLSNMSAELYAKRLALLKEAVPGVKQVALLTNSANPFTGETRRLSEAASAPLGLRLEAFEVREPRDFEQSFEKMSHRGVQGIVVSADVSLETNMRQLGELAIRYRLPLVAASNDVGVLVAFARDTLAMYRRAAVYVDKILRGANPADLPIEQPTRFILIINLKTAMALGLTIPQSLQLRADEVIQ